jgi:hypothetical protein
MKPTLKLLVVVLAVAAQGCVPDETIQIDGVYESISPGCVAEAGSTTQKVWGDLNVGWSGHYYLGVRLRSALDNKELTTGGLPVNPKERNDAYVTEMEVSFTCKDTKANCTGFPKYGPVVQQISVLVPAGGTADVPVDAMTVDMQDKLNSSPVVGSGSTDPIIKVTMLAGMKFRGKLKSGATFQTDTFYYPIQVYNDGTKLPVCVAPATVVPVGESSPPCNNFGQDGSAAECSTTL